MENIMNRYKIQLDEANFYRLGVMTFILLAQFGLIVPASLLLISVFGGSFISFAVITICSFTLLVLLLGDVTTKITIPLFIVSILVQLAIIFGTVI